MKWTHPVQFVDVLLHRQTVQSAGETEKSSQEARSKTQLQRKTRRDAEKRTLQISEHYDAKTQVKTN